MGDTPEFRLDRDKTPKEPERPEFIREDDGEDLPGLGEERPEFVREDDGEDLPGLSGHPDFELDPGKIDNAPDARGAVPMRPSTGVSAEAGSGGSPPTAPWWRWPAIVIGAIGLVVGVIAVTTGGGDSTTNKSKPRAEVTKDTTSPANADPRPAPANPTEPPTISAIDATFDPATYSTTYSIAAVDPGGTPLTYDWEWEPVERCGRFTQEGSTAVWAHPHKSQAGEPGVKALGLDEADLCDESTQSAGGHAGTVTVHLSSDGYRCEATFTEGSNDHHATDLPGACSAV